MAQVVFSKDVRHGDHLEDAPIGGVDLGQAVVQEVHRLVTHAVPTPVGDMSAALFPLLRTNPQHPVGVEVHGVVETQAVLAPNQSRGGIKPEQR